MQKRLDVSDIRLACDPHSVKSYAVNMFENVRLYRMLRAHLTIRLGTKILASSTSPGARLASTQISKKCSLGYELTSFLQNNPSDW